MEIPMRLALTVLCLLTCSTQWIFAAERTAHELLPKDVLIYFEVSNPADLIDLVVNHPLREKIEAAPQYSAAKETKVYQQLLAGIQLVEGHIGTDLVSAISKMSGGGIYAAFQPATEGVIVLIHSDDAEILEKTRATIVGLAKLADPESIRSTKYRDVKVYTREELKVAVMDSWLILTNKSEIGKSVVDAYRDGSSESLQQNEDFQTAYGNRPECSAWGFLDLASLRESGAAAEAFTGKAENPGAEILVGGLLEDVKNASHISVAANLKQQQFAVQIEVPHNQMWISEPR
ncbi:MAG: hypothetical protein ACI9HK_004788, partial [Pirellulaceae bacterium]